MKNYEKWAFKINSDLNWSEALQRLGFSYGYRWQNGSSDMYSGDIETLTFDPEMKIMDRCSSKYTEFTYVVSGMSLTEIIGCFNNPPEKIVTELKLNNGEIFKKNGDVFFPFNSCNGRHFDELIEKRKEFLGRTLSVTTTDAYQRFPHIEFLYANDRTKLQHILVTDCDLYHIKGYDMDDDYKFKIFKHSKIVNIIIFRGLASK